MTSQEYLSEIAKAEKSQFRASSFGTTEGGISETKPDLYDGLKELYIEEENYQKALEIAEEERQGALSLLLYSQMGKEVTPSSEIETLKIADIQQIAQQSNSTIVYYSKLLEDKIAIWVISPEGNLGFHQVTLSSATENSLSINETKSKYSLAVGAAIAAIVLALVKNKAMDKEKILLFLLLLALPACNKLNNEPTALENPYSFSTIKVRDSSFLSNTVRSTIAGVRGGSNRENELLSSSDCQKEETCLKDLHQVLIEPIERLLPKNPQQRIIFVPDAELHTVPFAALRDSEGQYVIDKHTIHRVGSLQSLRSLNVIANSKPDSSKATKALVVGNPIMPEVTIADSVEGTKQSLVPLPGTEKEAKAIANLLGTTPILGKDATETAITQEISKYSIIHFATHGVLNVKVNPPECAEATQMYGDDIALVDLCTRKSNGIDVLTFTPSPEDDGLLDVSEIYDLDLDADLVVMSACETGLGTISNEGVIGLARPFLARQVPSVVASLWSVPDNPTAELMVEFYQNLEAEPDKAQALRQAMLTIKNKYPEPSNWAGFTLIGRAN